MKIIVVYHNADFDGIFCREIVKQIFKISDVEYVGWNYGDPEPKVNLEDKLFILDLSIDGLMSHPNLTWIDHHKTAIDKYSKDIHGYRIDGVAACRLTWQWFNCFSGSLPTKEDYINRIVIEPYSVRLAGEYDIWDKRDSNTDVFQFGLRSTKDLDWNRLLEFNKKLSISEIEALIDVGHTNLLNPDGTTNNPYIYNLLDNGKLLQEYQQNNDTSIIKRGYDLTFEGIKFLALNTPRCNSLSFKSGINPEHQALLGYYFDGTKWNVSLYGVEGISPDLSEIAKKYGGGGHKQACGFNTKTLPF